VLHNIYVLWLKILFAFPFQPPAPESLFKRKNGKKESNLHGRARRQGKKKLGLMGGPFRGETVHPQFFLTAFVRRLAARD